MQLRTTIATLALLTAGISAHANLLDDLKNQAGGYTLPKIGTGTLGNAAGVLEYCVKNNYLGGDASSVKDKLLAKVSGQKPQQAGFDNGAQGLLQGGDGKSLNLKGLSSKVKEKACDYVLKNAGSLI